MSGCPPDNHPAQCRAKSRHTQVRCKKWALRGRNFCQFHGGRTHSTRHPATMSSRYSKNLGATLREAVKEFADAPHHESVNIREELDISRAICAQALTLASVALTKPKTVALGIETAREALNHVKDMVLAASRIEKDAEDKVSYATVDQFVKQIVAAIHRVLGDEEATAKKIEEEINRSVRIPSSVSGALTGISSTPSDLASSMDSMVLGDDDEED